MPWQPVDSSAATAVRYNAQQQWLDVEYTGGGRYRYFSVPADAHRELLAADSIGTYLNQCIKPYYRYSKLPSARN